MKFLLRTLLPCCLCLLFFAKNAQAQNDSLSLFIEGPQVLCDSQCATYYINVLGAPAQSQIVFVVTGPGGFANTLDLAYFEACQPGTYTIKATGYTANGQVVEAFTEYTIYPGLDNPPLYIVSSNAAPCNDSIPPNAGTCEKVCPGSTVTYHITSNIPIFTPIVTWQVTGAEAYTVNQDNTLTVTWGGAGSGNVSAYGFSTSGCGGSEASHCVTIIEAPQAAFGTQPTAQAGKVTICKGQTLYFQNASLNADYYEWDFGNGLSENATNPQQTYPTPGLYTVRLIARSACLCADTATLLVEVLDAATPMLDCVGTICPNETVTYTTSANCGAYQWNVSGNGNILSGGGSADQSITVNWNNGPIGTLTLQVTACSGSVCNEPAIIQVPIISDNAEIKGAARVCPEAKEVYSIEPFGGATFNWNLSSGGSITEGQGTNHITVQWNNDINQNTTHWVTVQYDNCYLGCGGQDSLGVKILSPFFINGPVEACAVSNDAFKAMLSATGVALSCDWTLTAPNNTTAWTSASPTANANIPFGTTAGAYQIHATPFDPNKTCTDKADWAISVRPQPAKPTGITGEHNICPGTAYSYAATGITPGNQVQWTQKNGAGAVATFAGNPSLATWGTANPRWIAAAQVSADGLGCTSDTVRVNVQDIPTFSLAGPNEACLGTKGTYSILDLENVDFEWVITPADAGAIASGSNSHSVEIFWQKPGNHNVKVMVCGKMATQNITVYPNPAPMAQHPAGLCPAVTGTVQTTGPVYQTWTWKDEQGSTVSTANAPMLFAGAYSVEVSDVHGCVGTTEFSMETLPEPNLTLSTPDPTGFCANSTAVTMYALTTTDGDYVYDWQRNGVSLGINQDIYSTNQYGLYTVEVTNQYGCKAAAGPLNIYDLCQSGGGGPFLPGQGPACAPGTAGFSIDPTAACDGYDFHNIPGPDYLAGSAEWTFGHSGGAIVGAVIGDDPSFTFPNAGWYIVMQRTQLTNGASCYVIDSVKVKAVGRFDADPKCPGDDTYFKDVSTFMPGEGIAAWAWDFDDPSSGANNTSSLRNPIHAFGAAGQYSVNLTITSTSGCTASFSQNVVVPDLPNADFALPTASCAGNALEFTAISQNDLTQTAWTFGEPASGAPNTANVSPAYHAYATAGVFPVKLAATNVYGCTSDLTKNITTFANPLAGNISIAPASPICEGKSTTMTAPSGGAGAAYAWSDGQALQANTVSTEGAWSVTITDTHGCTYAPPTVNIEVTPSPDALIKAILKNEMGQTIGTAYPALEICAGEDVFLQAVGNGNYGYSWSSGGFTPDVEFSEVRQNLLAVGTYNYIVTVTDLLSGCTSVTDPFIIDVHPNPTNIAIATSTFPNCSGTPTTLTYSGAANPLWQYNWNNGATGTSLTTTEPGDFFLTAVNEFGCKAESNHEAVLPGPNVDAIPSGCHIRCKPDTLCLPVLPTVVAWQWMFNGAAIPGATSPDFIATQDGDYTLMMTDYYGCKATSQPLGLQLYDGYGTLAGQVWSDVNNNGMIDAADTLVSGIDLILLQNGTNEGVAQSNATGDFAFANILSTDYTVQINTATLPVGWNAVIGSVAKMLSGCDDQESCDLLIHVGCMNVSSSLQLSTCAGDSVAYNGTFIQAGNSQVFTLTAMDGCDSLVTVTVDALQPTASALQLSACQGTSVVYNGTTLLAGSSQIFHLTSVLGCDSMVTVSVVPIAPISTSLDIAACQGDSVLYNGVWIKASESHEFNLISSLGCDSMVTVTAIAYFPVTNSLQLVGCQGESVAYNGAMIPTGTSKDFTFSTVVGCDSTVVVTVVALPRDSSAQVQTICPGTTFAFNGMDLAAGATHDFHFTGSDGCDSIFTVVVDAFPVLTYDILPKNSCPNAPTGSVEAINLLGGATPYQFSLDGSIFQDTTLFDSLPAGDYAMQVMDDNNCIFEQNNTIAAWDALQVSLPVGVLPCDSSGALLAPIVQGDTTGLTFEWSTGATSPQILVYEPGMYWVTVKNQCEITRVETVVEWTDSTGINSLIYVPNAFKPGSISGNDEFRAQVLPGAQVLDYKLTVFDRWGNAMFVSNRPEDGWDGQSRNKRLNAGVFVWMVQMKLSACGQEMDLKKEGDVMVVR